MEAETTKPEAMDAESVETESKLEATEAKVALFDAAAVVATDEFIEAKYAVVKDMEGGPADLNTVAQAKIAGSEAVYLKAAIEASTSRTK